MSRNNFSPRALASAPAWALRALAVLVCLAGFAAGAAADTAVLPADGPHATSVILMIGDGMGGNHIDAARWEKAGGDLAAYATVTLAMDRLPSSGTVSTSAADQVVTDSAAAITALMTGEKANYGVIGQDRSAIRGSSDGVRLVTLAELAEADGRSTGVVTDTRVTHATPAGAFAHVNHRDNELLIGSQLAESGLDVVLGGGYRFLLPWGVPDPWGVEGYRADGRDLVAGARAEGYTVVSNATALRAVRAGAGTKLLGLFATNEMEYAAKRAARGQPSLAEMTGKALSVLATDPDGFVLLVEGGLIDWASHYNDYQDMTGEVLAFDDAVEVSRVFAEQHPGTLLVVTADHECGGLSVRDVENRTKTFFFQHGGHTAADVRVMASGPGAAAFDGRRMENTGVFEIMRAALGLGTAAPTPTPGVTTVPGAVGAPGDRDGDGRYEDVNGNGRADFADVVLYFNQMTWIAENEPLAAFDFNANTRIDFADVTWLFNRL